MSTDKLSERVIEIVTAVLKEHGQVLFVDRTEPAMNSASYATFENLIDVVTDNRADNFEEIFRDKFLEKLNEYKARLENADQWTNPKLKTDNPVFTYRDPAVLPVPASRILVSISIGYPFVVNPELPRQDL